MDRMAWPARRGARWMVGAAQPRLVGDLEYPNIGFIGFFVFMLTMGIACSGAAPKVDEATQASTQKPS